jgi:hypothetical protein
MTKTLKKRSRNKKMNSINKKMSSRNKKNIKNRTAQRRYKGGNNIDDTLFLSCYDANLQKIQDAIAAFSGKHAIDRDAAERFINRQTTHIRKQTARDLIENTIYITLEEVSNIVEQLIVKLYTENDLNSAETIYMYTGDVTKSFYFMSVLALYYIRKHGFKEPTHFIKSFEPGTFTEIKQQPLILIDDASYSGSQLSNMLGNIYYNIVIKQKHQPRDLLEFKPRTCNYYFYWYRQS